MARKQKVQAKKNSKSSSEHVVQNNLGTAIGWPGSNSLVNFGQGYGGGNPWAPQISQMNTIFENLRWYLITNFRQPLSEAYVELGLIQIVVDIPVDDGFRGGIEIQSKQLSPDQIQELQISVDRDNDLTTIAQALKWTRLFGGGGVIMIIEDQDPAEPLNVQAIGPDTSVEFRAVDMWELIWDSQNTDGYDPEIQTEEFETYNYYGHQIHKSRVMRMKGVTAPSFIRPRLRGWGFSIVEPLIRSINQYLKATDLAFACLDEFKVDVYKIKNLVSTLMLPDGGASISARIQMANWQKNYQNALVMDSEDDWDHKQLSFAGLAETMQGIRMQVAADMRMPITKLFGTSTSGGIGNNDQNDLENYNSMVESQVRNKVKYDILRMLEIKCQKLFGFIPEDLQIDFKPLRVLSALDEETVKTAKFNRLMAASQVGKIGDEDLLDAINKDNLLGVQVKDVGMLNPAIDSVKEGEEDPDSPKDTKDPGANREDQKSAKPVFNEAESQDPKLADAAAPDNGQNLESPYESAFDIMAYQTEGGDDWISVQQMQSYDNPIDTKLWDAAAEASIKYIKTDNLKYRIWVYRKWGGAFGDPAYESEFDLMSYEFEGGNDWIMVPQMTFFKNPSDVVLWDKSADASLKYLKSDNEKYRIWWYRKKGGKFVTEEMK